MRTIRHWNVRYFFNRINEALYRFRHPKAPWLTAAAVDMLFSLLRRSDRGIEFGSGRSTLWFSYRVQYLTSVEHNCEWYAKVKNMLEQERRDNVDYHFRPVNSDLNGTAAEYAGVFDAFGDGTLDFVLVDGVCRDHCARRALPKLKKGGMLIIDNVNLYLPSSSYAPNARTFDQGPQGAVWGEVWTEISQWRSIWTSNGVYDTAVYFKPVE